MAVAITRANGRRADDVRALRFRFRTLTFSGSYLTGGETILASSVQLKRILAVVPCSAIIGNKATGAGVIAHFAVSTDGRSAFAYGIELGGSGAAGDPVQEKTNSEAWIASSAIDVLIVGE